MLLLKLVRKSSLKVYTDIMQTMPCNGMVKYKGVSSKFLRQHPCLRRSYRLSPGGEPAPSCWANFGATTALV